MNRFFKQTCTAFALVALFSGCSSSDSGEALTSNPSDESSATNNSPAVADLDLDQSTEADFELVTQGDSVTLQEYEGSASHAIVPEGVTDIASHSFSANDGLLAVTIADSTKTVANSAFSMCTNLVNVDFGGLEEIGVYAFAGCWSLTEVELPASVGPILERAFYDCTSLTSVVLGTGVDVVQTEAFAQCPKLSSVVVPISVAYIDSTAFDGASADLTFVVQEGSYGDTWAQEHGYAVSYGG